MRNRHLFRGALAVATSLAALTLFACGPQRPEQQAQSPEPERALFERASVRFDPLPATAPSLDNPVTDAKVTLGKELYYDTRLSSQGNISCNSCHDLATFGVDNQSFSPGDDGTLGGRNSPTTLNAAFHLAQFWDGRATDVEEQAGMPILNPVEMAIPSEEFLVERLAATEHYPDLFAEAFPEETEPLTYANIRNALAAFERTLITPSRFDTYLAGDLTALTEQEQAGLAKFMELGCATCHNGVNIGAASFQKFGLRDNYWEHTGSETPDEGRIAVTQDEADRFVFRVASLRNVEKTAPYFHDGSVETLDEALRIMIEVQLGIDVTQEEMTNVSAFLRTLTGTVPVEALRTGG